MGRTPFIATMGLLAALVVQGCGSMPIKQHWSKNPGSEYDMLRIAGAGANAKNRTPRQNLRDFNNTINAISRDHAIRDSGRTQNANPATSMILINQYLMTQPNGIYSIDGRRYSKNGDGVFDITDIYKNRKSK